MNDIKRFVIIIFISTVSMGILFLAVHFLGNDKAVDNNMKLTATPTIKK